MIFFDSIKARLLSSRFFKDSFWAVFGNGIGNALLLLSGILIARFMGKDLYGEYGLVKTTMFYVAAFSTFGLGYTSTKWIAEYLIRDKALVFNIVRDSLKITIVSSSILALLLIVFATPLSIYLEEPSLAMPLRLLGLIVICRALTTTFSGILAGFDSFKVLAYNSIYSGIVMICTCVPLTYFLGLTGALLSLLISQLFNTFINYLSVKKECRDYINTVDRRFVKDLLTFSVPVALQELSFSLCTWGSMLILTKWSTFGEVGLYTAASQWNAIILFIPGLLSNVMLTHLSMAVNNSKKHARTVNMLLAVSLVCTVIPFIIIYLLAPWIVSFYGDSFAAMKPVLRIMVFGTIFTCLTSVLSNELISEGKTWVLFAFRFSRDVLTIIGSYYVLISYPGEGSAVRFAIVGVIVGALFFLGLFSYTKLSVSRNRIEV